MTAKVNEDQMTLGASTVGNLYASMAQELFLRMIRRIKQRGAYDLQQDPYLWQLQKLNDMHMINEENIRFVTEQTGVAHELIDDIIKNEGLKVYQGTSEQLAEDLKKPVPSYNGVQETLARYAEQTFRDINNLVNQTLITTNLGENSAMRVYQNIIEQSVAEVVTGVRSADDAISRTVMKWLDKGGLPSAFIDKGGNTWSIERYVNTVMQSTTYRVYNEMRTSAATEMGVNTFHMSSHAAARPACAPIQGHIVTKAQHGFESGDKSIGYVESLYSHGYGEPGGTMGINCHHVLTPFIIGVNELPDEEVPPVDEAIANGEKQARQRAYERQIRDLKYRLEAAKALGDKGLIDRYNNSLRIQRSHLAQLLDENDFLHRDYSREKIYQNKQLIDAHQYVIRKKRFSEYEKFVAGMGDKKPSFEQWLSSETNKRVKQTINGQRHTLKMISSGKWGKKINPEKQRSHMKSTARKGGSYFDDNVDVQALFDTYAGTGHLEADRTGKFKNTEVIDNVDVNAYVITRNGDKIKATGIKIHHAKGRTHIVPFARKG